MLSARKLLPVHYHTALRHGRLTCMNCMNKRACPWVSSWGLPKGDGIKGHHLGGKWCWGSYSSNRNNDEDGDDVWNFHQNPTPSSISTHIAHSALEMATLAPSASHCLLLVSLHPVYPFVNCSIFKLSSTALLEYAIWDIAGTLPDSWFLVQYIPSFTMLGWSMEIKGLLSWEWVLRFYSKMIFSWKYFDS